MTRRLFYALACLATIALGLASRRCAAVLPEVVGRYAGDALWALMVYLALALLFPRWPPLRTGALALVACFAVEVSQLYHRPWIDAVRATRLGGLVLGHGFLWSDLPCYTAGVMVGLGLDIAARLLWEGPRPRGTS